MKLVSWNVNGLRACMNKGFKNFMDSVDADVFCVQETKMQREQANFEFPGYREQRGGQIANIGTAPRKKVIPARQFSVKRNQSV